ncbi:MAG: HAAAP family serine/threonine permease [Succinivibrionaceae bacterium]|nr:HAAAP family serine/threonine permease [Succinivibrionaceae bacterium]
MEGQGRRRWLPEKYDLMWVMNLFGTAIGAGILFLPISAGQSGLWPIIAITLIVGPMTYYAHRGLTRFVLSSPSADGDITSVAGEYFGPLAGLIINLAYFGAIYPILLIYGVSITNTVDSFWVNQLGLEPLPRVALSGACIAIYMGVILLGQHLVLIFNERLTYPLCAVLFLLSCYLIPHWSLSLFSYVPDAQGFLSTLWLCLPVLVFSFNHSPAISSCAVSMRIKYGANAEGHANSTLRLTSTILVLFVMFFVFSCALSLTPEDLRAADEQNLTILSYLANKLDAPFMAIIAPLVALLAISTSFFGHYLGAREGLNGIVARATGQGLHGSRRRKVGIAAFFFVTLWVVAALNPRVLGIIESLSGPLIALILFIMPMYAVARVPAMARYRGQWSNKFVAVMGSVTIASLILGLA